MSFVIDPRKNWIAAEAALAKEADPRRRQLLDTLIAHSKTESIADFDGLMATVSPVAHYHSFVGDDAAMNEAQSPKGKDGIAAYYGAIVESNCHRIEFEVDRLCVGENTITTEGLLKMAYPGAVLGMMGIDVPDKESFYLYRQRLMIVWDFDEDGLVLCEDSYGGPGEKFDGIADRPLTREQVYEVSAADTAA
jgi:hypothetical protein